MRSGSVYRLVGPVSEPGAALTSTAEPAGPAASPPFGHVDVSCSLSGGSEWRWCIFEAKTSQCHGSYRAGCRLVHSEHFYAFRGCGRRKLAWQPHGGVDRWPCARPSSSARGELSQSTAGGAAVRAWPLRRVPGAPWWVTGKCAECAGSGPISDLGPWGWGQGWGRRVFSKHTRGCFVLSSFP